MISGNLLITGGAGFLGRGLLRRAKRDGWPLHHVAVFSRDDAKHAALQRDYPDVQTILGDVGQTDPDYLAALFRGFDIVIHAAASKYVDRSEHAAIDTFRTNYLGTERVALAAIQARVGQVVGISTDKACVDYAARVELADGSNRAIVELVRDHSTDSVRTVGAEGVLTESPITGWYKNRRGDRRMIAVSYEHGPRHRGFVQRALVTEDHPVLTVQGWLPAKDVDGVDLVTSESAPNKLQERLLVGTLLGDAHARRGRSGLQRYQAGAPDWNTASATALTGLKASMGPAANGTTLRTRSAGWAGRLRDQFYPDGKKIVPRSLVERNFSAEMLAAWYMDDGTTARDRRYPNVRPLARLATHSFPEADVRWLADLFTARGLPATVQRVAWRNYGPYYELRLTADGSERLFAEIGRFIVPSMRRKLPDWAPQYDSEAWVLGPPVPFIARGHAVEQEVAGRAVYCLDIKDTHNFAVSGVVLHNCQPVNNYGASKFAAERVLQEANGLSDTRFTVCRYGNVVGSTGSVVRIWQDALAREQPLRITDPLMTRFWMSVDEAVDCIIYALTAARGGSVVIPQPRSMTMGNLARMVLGFNEMGDLPDEGVEVIGARPGEKRHESLLHAQESVRVVPATAGPYLELRPPGEVLTNAEFDVTSDQPPAGWLGLVEMRQMVEDAVELVP